MNKYSEGSSSRFQKLEEKSWRKKVGVPHTPKSGVLKNDILIEKCIIINGNPILNTGHALLDSINLEPIIKIMENLVIPEIQIPETD